MLSDIEELYQIKRKKYKEVDAELDNVLFMEAVNEVMIAESINAKSRELMRKE